MAWLGISTRDKTPPIERGGWLDALRFIVATLIILHHYELAAPIPLNQIHPIFERAGYLLTNFFLMDSGYVLARVYGERVAAGRMSPLAFFKKRFLRVAPAHLLMCATLVAMVLGTALIGISPRHPEWFDWKELPSQALLLQAFGVPGGKGWNAPSWSISALLGCYLAFPWLIRLTTRVGPWTMLALGVALYGAANLATWRLVGYPVYQMPLGYGFMRALPLFLLGMALARFAENVYLPPRLAGTAGIAAAVTLGVLQLAGRFSLISIALIAVIIIAAGAIPVVRRSWLVEKAAVVSFSMYITNEIVRIVWFGVANQLQDRLDWSQPLRWGVWAAAIPVAIAFAVGFHSLIDMPTQRAWNGGRKPAPPNDPSRLAGAARPAAA